MVKTDQTAKQATGLSEIVLDNVSNFAAGRWLSKTFQ